MLSMKTRIAALAAAITNASTEIQLFPAGEFAAVDGRPSDVDGGKWVINAALASVLVAQVASATTPLVIDYEHQTLRTTENGQPAPASGWFSQVEWREGVGLYAVGVEWTEKAAAMIAAGEYRFISPVFTYNKRGEVCQLLHAALTNTPALDGMDAVMLAAASRLASLSTETETTKVDEEQLAMLLANLRWLLNLPETTTPEELCAELKKVIDAVSAGKGTASASIGLMNVLRNNAEQIASLSANVYDPAKHIDLASFNELQTRYVALSQTSSTQEQEGLVTAALSDGRLMPTQEQWAKDYAKKDLSGFKAYLDKAPKIAALSQSQSSKFTPPNPEKKANVATLTPDQLAICSMFGNDPAEIAQQLED